VTTFPNDGEICGFDSDKKIRNFEFNQVFNMESNQGKIFEDTAALDGQSIVDGYNVCIFAYGQTGSGNGVRP